MAIDLMKLNEEQKIAVTHGEGPLLIVAGAGTGKTAVITQRVAYLIEKGLAKPEEILAVTFTEKAAGEMEERVDKMLPYGYIDLWISTFHSFCERVLREHALDIGLPGDFKILDQTAAWLLMFKNLDKFNLDYYKSLGNPAKFIQALISHFSHCKDQAIYPEDYLKYADDLKTRDDVPEDGETERIKEVASAYHVYQKLLLENSYLDFGDLINYCLKIFQQRPLILKRYREKFKYILVDEFQDTNWAQYELIKILTSPKNNLTVCADDDQAIYRWRGASFSNIIQFKKDFPETKQISLVRNYRSSQDILDLAYKFIKANDPDRLEYVNKINKQLVADKDGKGVIKHIHAQTLEEETNQVIKKISEILKSDKEASCSDFAILVRANDHAQPFIKALERAGLPYQFLASKGLYSKPVILDIISYFKLLDNYHESSALFRVLNFVLLDISTEDIMKLTQYSSRKTKSLYEAAEDLPLIQGISPKTQEKISFILSLIKKHSILAGKKNVSEILVIFLEDSGYLRYLVEKDDKEQLDLLNQFYKKIKNFEEANIDATLNNFMHEMKLELESGESGSLDFDSEQGPDMIKVMTIHGAKGLEFKYVFLVNMVDRRFPTIERKDPIEVPDALIKDIKPKGDVHLQEERRLCYVAMTRAKKGIYFTSAEDYGGARRKKPSRFMIEMGYNDKSEARSTKSDIGKSDFPQNFEGSQIFRHSSSYQLPDHFSYSQLAAFEKCPLQYKYAFILRVPVRGKAVFSFGKTMHNTLYQFLKQANEVNKAKQNNLFGFKDNSGLETKFPSGNLVSLISIYEDNWIDEWYENKKQKEEYYELGKKIAKDFYADFNKNYPKILKMNNDLALEMPFNLKIEDNIIRGVIDRIDEIPEGVRIIDYKTGESKDKLDSDSKEQLLIYQIAAEEIFKIKPKELVYYYLNDGKKASFLGSDKEKDELKEKILEEIGAIKTSDFAPTPGWQCSYCDFCDICDFAER
ncbi:MAG: UvrD-helicase domain-containing protein [Candidatus Nealsonbacteria bacterium]|nr:UvrD-helicase domain-containing protein [Candidatus Nealsonbacteria bacterium]